MARSLRVLDSVCSSILGRSCGTPPLQTDTPLKNTALASCNRHRSLALCASYKSTAILESIVQSSSDEEVFSNASAETYLEMLQEWSEKLPRELRKLSISRIQDPVVSSTREEIIGNIHAACTYYFGVILATRQCLILYMIRHLRATHRNSTRGSSRYAIELPGSQNDAALTKACTDAATYMIQMCWEASECGALLGNMCVLK